MDGSKMHFILVYYDTEYKHVIWDSNSVSPFLVYFSPITFVYFVKKVLIFELGQDFHLLPTMPRCLNVLVFHHFTKASLNDALSTDGGTNRDF